VSPALDGLEQTRTRGLSVIWRTPSESRCVDTCSIDSRGTARESEVTNRGNGRLDTVEKMEILVAAVLAGCASEEMQPAAPLADVHEGTPPTTQAPPSTSQRIDPGSPDEVGLATWYGRAFAWRKTADGERFDPNAMTAAHRRLPFGTWVEVRRPDTGRRVRVRINDRGPWGDSRKVIDLSQGAARELGIVGLGVAPVELRIVRGPTS
jgi:rare lipoprotein A